MSRHSLHYLYDRQLSRDPFQQLTAFKSHYYSRKSFVQRLQLERNLCGHEGCVNCINFSFSGQLLASASDDLHLILWDWARGKALGKYDTGHVANVFQAKFMPYTDDKVIVTAARDGQIRLLVLSSTGEIVHTKRLAHHNDSAHKLCVQPGSPHTLLSCGEDGAVLELDLREENKAARILVCKNAKNRRIPLYSIFIDPSDYSYFAVSGRDQYARIYDKRLLKESNDPVKVYCPHHLDTPDRSQSPVNITCLVYSHDGKELLCSYNDDDIYLFDTCHSTGAEHVKKYTGHRNNATVKGVNFFGLQSEYIVSGSDCGHVFLWDKNSEQIVQCLEGDEEGVVNCLEPHPYIPVLATSGLDHDVKVFTPTAHKPTTLEHLPQIVQTNAASRTEAESEGANLGMEAFMDMLMQVHRRRGFVMNQREEVGNNELSDSDESSSSDGNDTMDSEDNNDPAACANQ